MFKNQIHDMDAWVEERLSDYLDGTLSPQDRAAVEAHLQTSERARASLETLRWTVSLLKQTPAPALPRQFTLPVTPRVPARRAPSWMVWALRGVAVAATAAFVILLVGTLLRQPSANNMAMVQQDAPASAPSGMIAMVPTDTAPTATSAIPVQNNMADIPNANTPVMITVESPAPANDATSPTKPATRAAKAPPQPQATQETKAAQPSAPPASAQDSNPVQPTQAPVALEMQPTNVPAGASNAAGAAPELATASATDAAAAQRTFGVQGIDGVITAERLKVRVGPGAQYRTIAVLQRADRVTIVGQSETPGWLAIQYMRDTTVIEGWIAARFVRPAGSLDTVPIIAPSAIETPDSAPPTAEITGTPELVQPTDASETPPANETPATPTSTPEG